MAEKDILDALNALRGEVSEVRRDVAALAAKVDAVDAKVDAVDAKVDAVDAKVDAVDAKVEAVDAKVDTHRAETAAGFAALDVELEKHAGRAHRDLERDIAALHKGLVRAKVPGVPTDLPSQVRAKADRKGKPAKKRKAR